jgi:hypothetical protein
MDEHNKYIRFIEHEIETFRGAKVKSKDVVSGIVKILNHFMNKGGNIRKYVFMYPTRVPNPRTNFTTDDTDDNNDKVEISVRDITNDMSSCVVFDISREDGYVILKDFKTKYGECALSQPYKVPPVVKDRHKLESTIPLEIVKKIFNNVYHEFPLA